MRQETRQAVRSIKERVRNNAFTYTDQAFEEMVDQSLYEEDVKRAVSTARLIGLFRSGPRKTGYILLGFGMDEQAIEILCSIGRSRIVISGATRL